MCSSDLGSRRLFYHIDIEETAESTTTYNYKYGQKIFGYVRATAFTVKNGERQQQKPRFFCPLRDHEKEIELAYSVEYVIVGDCKGEYKAHRKQQRHADNQRFFGKYF